MSSKRITVRVSLSLAKQLKKYAAMKRLPVSSVVREALQGYLKGTSPRSAYDLARAAGLIGFVRGPL
jgi:Ribbon-helix-helix protein, copG family